MLHEIARFKSVIDLDNFNMTHIIELVSINRNKNIIELKTCKLYITEIIPYIHMYDWKKNYMQSK